MESFMTEPRSAYRLVRAALELYLRYPLLFLVLAAGVIVPYEAIVLAATGAGPFAQGSLSFGASSLLTLIGLALIGPLVSALHVHAVSEVLEGREPRLASVARRGLRVLPVVAAAEIVAWLGIALGFLAFVVPGIILLLRWYVVAQAAAIEHEGWSPALRRSRQLTASHYRHLIVFAIYVALITFVPTLLVGFAFGHETTTVASFLVGVALRVVTWSLSALAAALMYFDLRARWASTVAQPGPAPAAPAGGDPPQIGQSWDPRRYSDQDRPKGWYIDPGSPDRMRYWRTGDLPGWEGTTGTPKKVRREWQEELPDDAS
ncbi:MAG TPA: hypothetical protein VH042_09755 [Solirubrobacterales bacterium]|nr:hypothetical protein [Solirubrobacterales bacterium]